MKSHDKKVNAEKLLVSLKNNVKVHIILNDTTWRNGYVVEMSADFFIFDDSKNGKEPIFLIEVAKVEPYVNDKEEEK